MRVVFLGSGEFGLPTLRALAESHEVVGVVSQPDRPAGRTMRLTPTPIARWAADRLPGIPLFKPEDVNDPAIVERIRALRADAWIVIAFGQKLGEPLLRDVFAINLHASLLPRWRGAAPINHAVLAGDAETGDSVITLAQRMDAGLVLAQTRRPIEPHQTAGELHDLLAEDGPALVLRVLDEHARGSLTQSVQDESLATRAPKLRRDQAVIDFSRPADECRRLVHGLTPWPGVAVEIAGERVGLLRVQAGPAPTEQSAGAAGGSLGGASPRHRPDAAPGTLIDAARGLVRCGGETTLQLIEVQPAGRRPMGWDAFARGRSLEDGLPVDGGRAP